MQFTIDEPTPLLNVWQRLHWSKRGRLTERLAWLIRAATGPIGKPLKKCKIEVARYSARRPDVDGLYGGLKPLLDCLVVTTPRNPHGLGLIVDDNPDCIVKLVARSVKCKRGEGKTTVKIEGMD